MASQCEHFVHEKKGITPNTKSCEECEKEHMPVVAIRMCLTCGHVGYCDSSIGKHATKHFNETGHPVMKAILAIFGNGVMFAKNTISKNIFQV